MATFPQIRYTTSIWPATMFNLIATGLKEFDTRNHNNPEITMDHYVALAWDGLRGTKAWNDLRQEVKAKINNDSDYIINGCWCSVINCN